MPGSHLLLTTALVEIATVGHLCEKSAQAARRRHQKHAGVGLQIGLADQHPARRAAVGCQRQQNGFFGTEFTQTALYILALVSIAQSVGIGDEKLGIACEVELGNFVRHGTPARQRRFETVGAALVEYAEGHGVSALEIKPQLIVMFGEPGLPVERRLDFPLHRGTVYIGHSCDAPGCRTVIELQGNGRRKQHGRAVAGDGIGQRIAGPDIDGQRSVGRNDPEIGPVPGGTGIRKGQYERKNETAEKVHTEFGD